MTISIFYNSFNRVFPVIPKVIKFLLLDTMGKSQIFTFFHIFCEILSDGFLKSTSSLFCVKNNFKINDIFFITPSLEIWHTHLKLRVSLHIFIQEKYILPIPFHIWYITEYNFIFLFHAFNVQMCCSQRYFYLIVSEMAVFFRVHFFLSIKQSHITTLLYNLKRSYTYRTDALDFCYNKFIIYIQFRALHFFSHILWLISQQSIFSMENVLVIRIEFQGVA